MRVPASAILALLFTLARLGSAEATPTASAPAAALSPDGFQRAGVPGSTREWRFPRDHGRHDAYRLEWWYYTGILRTAAGRVFGYQVTFFRSGLSPDSPRRDSAWAVRSLYLAHVALSDVAGRRYLHDSRAGRDSLGLSGAAPDRMQVWVGPWRADPLPDDSAGVRLAVEAAGFSLALTLHGEAPPVLNGVGGLSRKGPQPGQATWYYSLPRLSTEGTLRLDGNSLAVRGESWMDHEFGTSQLAPELAGWDWMGLRLDDGSGLMLYRLRRRDGSPDPRSGGTYIAADGRASPVRLEAEGTPGLTPGRVWKSPASGAAYPLEWQIELPGQGLRLRVTPLLDGQEQPPGPGTPFPYWEGAVRVEGERDGRPLAGEGYLELTGYAGRLEGSLR